VREERDRKNLRYIGKKERKERGQKEEREGEIERRNKKRGEG